jgi:sulfur transfer protein SufE
MKEMIAKLVQDEIEKTLFSGDTKSKIVKGLNDSINIPILNEKTEEKIFEAIWEVVEDVARVALDIKK